LATSLTSARVGRGLVVRLARDVAPRDDHLLRNDDALRRDLDAEVAARHHDAVGLGDDRVDIVDALVVLNLGKDKRLGGARP
jgi:hypothetical protein